MKCMNNELLLLILLFWHQVEAYEAAEMLREAKAAVDIQRYYKNINYC